MDSKRAQVRLCNLGEEKGDPILHEFSKKICYLALIGSKTATRIKLIDSGYVLIKSKENCIIATLRTSSSRLFDDDAIRKVQPRIEMSSRVPEPSETNECALTTIRLYTFGLHRPSLEDKEIVTIQSISPWKLPIWDRLVLFGDDTRKNSRMKTLRPGIKCGEIREALSDNCIPAIGLLCIGTFSPFKFEAVPSISSSQTDGKKQIKDLISISSWGLVTPSTSIIHASRSSIFKREEKRGKSETSTEDLNASFPKNVSVLKDLFGKPFEILHHTLSQEEDQTPKMILLNGPSGCGKTSLAHSVASLLNLNIMTPDFSHLQRNGLWSYFLDADRNSGTQRNVIVIENLSSLIVKNESNSTEGKSNIHSSDRKSEKRSESEEYSQSCIRMAMDLKRISRAGGLREKEYEHYQLRTGLPSSSSVVAVIGCTRDISGVHPHAVDAFQARVQLEFPGVAQRVKIMQHYLFLVSNGRFSSKDLSEDLWNSLADVSGGFSGAGIAVSCRDIESPITYDKILRSFQNRRDRGEQKWSVARSSVRWGHVGGIPLAKKVLKELAILPLLYPQAFKTIGVSPPRGLLMFGPPGTGKTMLAKAVAGESRAKFLTARIPDLIKGEVGASVKAIRELFLHAARASPCIVFLDELQAMFARREEGNAGWASRSVSQLLLEIDTLRLRNPAVVLLAATNAPEALDPALLRRGRLDRHVYVGPPETPDQRYEIISKLAEGVSIDRNVDMKKIAEETKDFTGADLAHLFQSAGLRAIQRIRKSSGGYKSNSNVAITSTDFFSEIKRCAPPPARVEMARRLKSWSNNVNVAR